MKTAAQAFHPEIYQLPSGRGHVTNVVKLAVYSRQQVLNSQGLPEEASANRRLTEI